MATWTSDELVQAAQYFFINGGTVQQAAIDYGSTIELAQDIYSQSYGAVANSAAFINAGGTIEAGATSAGIAITQATILYNAAMALGLINLTQPISSSQVIKNSVASNFSGLVSFFAPITLPDWVPAGTSVRFRSTNNTVVGLSNSYVNPGDYSQLQTSSSAIVISARVSCSGAFTVSNVEVSIEAFISGSWRQCVTHSIKAAFYTLITDSFTQSPVGLNSTFISIFSLNSTPLVGKTITFSQGNPGSDLGVSLDGSSFSQSLTTTVTNSTQILIKSKTSSSYSTSYGNQLNGTWIIPGTSESVTCCEIIFTFITSSAIGANADPDITDPDITDPGTDPDIIDPGANADASQVSASLIASIIGNKLHDIFIRESIEINIEIDFPDEILVNDESDLSSNLHQFGWRAWKNPTQGELEEDLKLPDNLWEPIFGDYTPITSLSSTTLKGIKSYQEAKLVLNDGTEIEKYQSTWSEFSKLNDIVLTKIFDGSNSSKEFLLPSIENFLDQSRVQIYINGVQYPASSISINDLTVTYLNTPPLGAKIVVIYKKYSPNKTELSFNPEVLDDILTNTQYKFGYDYTSFEIRDSNDKLSKSTYYFWVKNKNSATINRKMSIQQAKNLLMFGPTLYTVPHHISDATDLLPVRYDAVSIFGLNKFATRDDTYKLRFTRNFTLRDDPNELDLKNVHAEWALLRPAQNVRIPLTLWDKLVDSAVGADIVGNQLPFTHLRDYDLSHGTSNCFGLGLGQILAEKPSVIASIKHTILNTSLTLNLGGTLVPDYIQFLKLSQLDKYFDTPENIRKTLNSIWREAKPRQINEIFFAVINDALANNFEFKDIFKTSRLSVYSIKTVGQILTGTNDE